MDDHMLKKEIIKILACPKCKGHVEYDKKNEVISCKTCNLKYLIKQGIPVMLIEEAQKYK